MGSNRERGSFSEQDLRREMVRRGVFKSEGISGVPLKIVTGDYSFEIGTMPAFRLVRLNADSFVSEDWSKDEPAKSALEQILEHESTKFGLRGVRFVKGVTLEHLEWLIFDEAKRKSLELLIFANFEFKGKSFETNLLYPRFFDEIFKERDKKVKRIKGMSIGFHLLQRVPLGSTISLRNRPPAL